MSDKRPRHKLDKLAKEIAQELKTMQRLQRQLVRSELRVALLEWKTMNGIRKDFDSMKCHMCGRLDTEGKYFWLARGSERRRFCSKGCLDAYSEYISRGV